MPVSLLIPKRQKSGLALAVLAGDFFIVVIVLLAQQGKISFWVRNLVRKEGCSFFLQKADGRFYPDFLCQLPSGVILAVEYKGGDRWTNAEDDRLTG